MPLKKCSQDSQNGWKWGDSGKCYTGRDAKKKAIKQGVVIEGPKKFQELASSFKEPLSENDIESVAEALISEGYQNSTVVATLVGLRNLNNEEH
jgi:hypothetical protein|tara:strand:- start:1050 stop:1331 length:282 start_codon:yes stop_codon:yes gene_type:complete